MLHHFWIEKGWNTGTLQVWIFILFFKIFFYFVQLYLRKVCTKFQKAPPIPSHFWLEKGETLCRYEFLLFYYSSSSLSCPNIATKYVYEISKGCIQPFQSYITFWRKRVKMLCRYEFLFFFYYSFFALFNYSYEMCVPNFEGLHPALPKLHHIWRGGAHVPDTYFYVVF